MSKVKFYTGTETNIDDKTIENGAIYFTNKNGSAVIAYDMNNSRYWINYPSVFTLAEMVAVGNNYIPKAGEIVVISDAYTENNVPMASIKIGDGVKNIIALPFIGTDTDISILKNHMNDSSIHHTHTVSEHTYIVTPTPAPNENNG